ncbi:plasmid mobilization relaxosome protein MobC [Paraflavisolibacter sp. H34]|uniref:plasmid mobilization protein n=1 Tax=Huijunlia imazamoxiresistens TaxID=3127457 RepID=UPI003018ADA7
MKKKNSNSKGGRPPLNESVSLSRVLRCRVSREEFEKIRCACRASGFQKLSAYLRVRLLQTENLYVASPVQFIGQLSTLSQEMNRIGNNINQLARYANTCMDQNRIDPLVLESFNKAMLEYLGTRNELITTLKAFYQKASL